VLATLYAICLVPPLLGMGGDVYLVVVALLAFVRWFVWVFLFAAGGPPTQLGRLRALALGTLCEALLVGVLVPAVLVLQ
jgi:formate hydrogenlyase subunit 4